MKKKKKKENKLTRQKAMEFIYQKEPSLNEEDTFTIEISKKNNVEKEKFNGGNNYLISS